MKDPEEELPLKDPSKEVFFEDTKEELLFNGPDEDCTLPSGTTVHSPVAPVAPVIWLMTSL